VRHVVAPEPTSVGRCSPKLQLTWHRVDAHPAPYLDLELVCGGTRSLGYRQCTPYMSIELRVFKIIIIYAFFL
jgi:hypothetical protein